MRRSNTTYVLVLLICAVFLYSCAACSVKSAGIHIGSGGPAVKGGPPPHAPAHGYRAKHQYHYYPNAYVYFDMSRNVYFYLEGDHWKMSASLPNCLAVQLGHHVLIEMDSDKPYMQFESHKKKYPPGQRKKEKNWAKKHNKV